jgi:protocatechuate 3,4-dioxygenase beta subunit
MRLRLCIGLLLICATGVRGQLGGGPPQPAGLIVGQVVDALSDRGVAEAIVSIAMVARADGSNPTPQISAGVRRRVIADDEGRFFFMALPEGRFSLTVSKRGYVNGSHGQRRPGGSLQYVELSDGQRRGQTDIRIWPTAAIEGVVLDEQGEPVVNTVVNAVRRVDLPGRPRYSSTSLFARTDDRGAYRIAGLDPGSYLVLMSGSRTTFPVETLAPDESKSIQSEAFRVTNEIQALGGERHLTQGRFVLATPSSTATLPPQVPGQPLRVYRQVVHPAHARMDQAEPIVLSAGETRRNVDLQIRAVPTISVSGRVTSSDAALGVVGIRLIPEGQALLISDKGFDAASALTRKDGTFTILGVPEGRYELRINSPRVLDPADTAPDSPRDSYWASVAIDASTRDIADIVVPVTRTQPLLGRVQFDVPDSGTTGAGEYINLETASHDAARVTSRIRPDGTFALSAGPGKYVVRADPPIGWFVRSITHHGRDVLDTPFTVGADPIVDIIVTFTKQAAALSGTVRGGQQMTDLHSAVLLIPAEPRMWQGDGLLSRRFSMARVRATGGYRFGGVSPGDYLALAVDDSDTADWKTAERIPQLAALATRVTIAPGANVTLDLKTVVLPTRSASPMTPPTVPAALPMEASEVPHGPFADESQIQPRDAAAAVIPTGTSRVEGRVVGTGQPAAPVRGALVNIRATDPAWGSTAITDDDGRFVFEGVPAGRYSLVATKAAWLRAVFGATRPGRPGTPLTVADSQRIENLTLVMARGSVITGRVFDQQGRPVQGVQVDALTASRSTMSGERQLDSLGPGVTTDDQGGYRLWGLAPGSYVVRAAPEIESRTQQAGGLTVAQLTRAEVDRAHTMLSGGQGPGSGLSDAQRPLTEGVATVYSHIFAPGTSDSAQASAFTLAIGEEHRGADITLSYTAAIRVRGVVRQPDGAPAANVAVEAVPSGPAAALLRLAATVSSQARTDGAGAFVLPPLAPGQYLIRAVTRGETPMFAASEVTAVTDTTTSLMLAPMPPLTVRLVFDGVDAPPTVPPLSQILLVPMGSGGDLTGAPRGTPDGSGHIMIPAVPPGRYTALFMSGRGNDAAQWTRYESIANGRDTFEHGIDVGVTGTVDWSIHYTRQPSRLEGSFADASGRPAPDYFIVVFPQDRSHWVGQSQRIRLLRPDLAGAFTTVGLPDGAYYVAALTDVAPAEERDPEFLASLVASALSISIEKGKTTRQDIRVGGGR